jgi:hypothetical protein
MRLRDLGQVYGDDAYTLLCGEQIGAGMSRIVFACPLNDNWVVKLETNDTAEPVWQNVREYTVWKYVQAHWPCLEKWFAPIHTISGSGHWMIQHRTQPVGVEELKKRVPRVPAFFCDLKDANWGRIGKRYVCHDYGTASVMDGIGLTAKLRKANWWTR